MDELKEFAIGLTGRTEIVMQWAANKEVNHTGTVGVDTTYCVIKNGYLKFLKT